MTYVAFLRGINVGGNHKVPMAELRQKLIDWGCENVKTILNSGNVIFDIRDDNSLPPTSERDGVRGQFHTNLESTLESYLSDCFGFPIPVMVRTMEEMNSLVQSNPFKHIAVHTDLRLYVSLLKTKPDTKISLPYISEDESFQILAVRNSDVISVVDLSKGKTVNGMNDLEKLFGKNITTRNWNTINKIVQ
jgi:uncharacterized protein (DUF1697 family)